jgi:hypothetical protein
MWKYPDEVVQFIADNVSGRTARELAELTNAAYGTSFTESSMKSYKSNHDLKSGTQCGLPAGRPTERYPENIRRYIEEKHVGIGPGEMAALLNQTFDTNYTTKQIKGYYANHKINSGLTGHYQKGHIPENKGKPKFWVGGEETQFKKGQKPHNYMPVGSERVNTDGYHDVKIADPNKWRAKHVLLWEEHNGPVPKGHKLIFGDGDKNNVSIDNIILVTNSQMAVLNHFNLIQRDANLTRTGIAIANIKTKINERKRNNGKTKSKQPMQSSGSKTVHSG